MSQEFLKTGTYTYNGKHVCDFKNYRLNNIDLKILSNFISKQEKKIPFHFVGELEIDSQLTMGDQLVQIVPNFKEKKYYIYKYFNNFIASSKKLSSLNSLFKHKFYTNPKINVSASYGLFVFADLSYIEKYNKLLHPINIKTGYYSMIPIKSISMKKMKQKKTSKYFTNSYKIKDIKNKTTLDDKKFQQKIFRNDPEKIIFYDSKTGTTDKLFDVLFSEDNSIVIQCSTSLKCVLEKIIKGEINMNEFSQC